MSVPKCVFEIFLSHGTLKPRSAEPWDGDKGLGVCEEVVGRGLGPPQGRGRSGELVGNCSVNVNAERWPGLHSGERDLAGFCGCRWRGFLSSRLFAQGGTLLFAAPWGACLERFQPSSTTKWPNPSCSQSQLSSWLNTMLKT